MISKQFGAGKKKRFRAPNDSSQELWVAHGGLAKASSQLPQTLGFPVLEGKQLLCPSDSRQGGFGSG